VLQNTPPSPLTQAAEAADGATPRLTSRRRGSRKSDIAPPALDGKMLKDVQASFAHLDTNHDGLLSLEEFTAGLGLLSMNAEFATIIFNAFDRSGDGMIDRREFVTAIGVMLHPEDMERQVCFFCSDSQ
jgi:Ca2+-binding EF-hand superfamily protein